MLEKVLAEFGFVGSPEEFGDGHINSTYKIKSKYILQKINTNVFTNPQGVMENAFAVTGYIRKQLALHGVDPSRKTIEFVRTAEGDLFYEGEEGVYRLYRYIDDAFSYTTEKTPAILYEGAKIIGEFQQLLSDFDASRLFTVIPDFHHTPKRLENLKKAVERNASGRAANVKDEIEFAYSMKDTASLIIDAIEDGSVPLRVSHNDTKLNNILFDKNSGKGLCLIDLDTVMSGSYLYDYGDALRFGGTYAPEDSTDLDHVTFDLQLFEAFTKGYLESAGKVLTKREKELLFSSVIIMTYEVGIRFLADYIDGDVYFKTAYPTHNLDRARNQLTLVKDMLKKQDAAEAIVKKYL